MKGDQTPFADQIESPQRSLINMHKLYVVTQLWWRNTPMSAPMRTSSKSFFSKWNYEEWIEFPIGYDELHRNTVLTFDLYSNHGANKEPMHIGGSTVTLFDAEGCLHMGNVDLKVWIGQKSDGRSKIDSIKTPGRPFELLNTAGLDYKELVKESNLIDKETSKRMPSAHESELKSLNRLDRISKLVRKYEKCMLSQNSYFDEQILTRIKEIFQDFYRRFNYLILTVRFERFVHPHSEKTSLVYSLKEGTELQTPYAYAESVLGSPFRACFDGERDFNNCTQEMHLFLNRSSGMQVDKTSKPDLQKKEMLTSILKYPPGTILKFDEQELIWECRHYLASIEEGICKLLQCVRWSENEDIVDITSILRSWTTVNIDDLLVLLGPNYKAKLVRKFAVEQLNNFKDDEMILYLPQLVQALRYENSYIEDDGTSAQKSVQQSLIQNTCLRTFLSNRAAKNLKLATFLYWYLTVEVVSDEEIHKICKNANRTSSLYKEVLRDFLKALKTISGTGRQIHDHICAQQSFVSKLEKLSELLKNESGSKRKQELLHSILRKEDNPLKYNFMHFTEPFPLPLDPHKIVCGIEVDSAHVYPSVQSPFKLVFKTMDGGKYTAIFKNGDDLRQDQLVLQLIVLIDKVMQRENIDLKLTPYTVLATSTHHGLVQYIDAIGLRNIKAQHQSIYSYLDIICEKSKLSKSHMIDNYVKSCAGYCVITYLLGVGDRHMDNLMIRPSGHLFHIDFSYLFGRDPKPMAPVMKLNKDMIISMGNNVGDFRKYCFTAFLHLRRHANMILNVLSLMLDANIPDIQCEPDKTIHKVHTRFRLDLDDEAAVLHLQKMIDQSISALLPQLMDILHNIAASVR
ncbi:hypothetical protein ACOME3_009634 [Neoechinorhynchus agilis]